MGLDELLQEIVELFSPLFVEVVAIPDGISVAVQKPPKIAGR